MLLVVCQLLVVKIVNLICAIRSVFSVSLISQMSGNISRLICLLFVGVVSKMQVVAIFYFRTHHVRSLIFRRDFDSDLSYYFGLVYFLNLGIRQ